MNGASGRHWPSAVRVVSTHVVETGADDDVVNDMIHDRVVVRPLSRWCRFLMRYCVRGTALVMSFRFVITSRRNERTLSLALPNVVHPIRITCMRCIFFQVKSGMRTESWTLGRPDWSPHPPTLKLNNVTALVLTLRHLFLTDYRVQLCSDVTMECNDAILYMPQINKGRA